MAANSNQKPNMYLVVLSFLRCVKLPILCFLSVTTLLGCGDGGEHDSEGGGGSRSSITISGIASKGSIAGGTVTSYQVANGVKGAALGSAVTTDASGNYLVDIGSYSGPVLLEVRGGSYKDEATGATTTLSAPLQSVVVANTNGLVSAQITPLTDLLVKMAQVSSGGLSAANITTAAATLKNQLGFDPVVTTPVDATDPASATAPAARRAYAAYLGVVSQYLKNNPGQSITLAVTQFFNAVRNGGLTSDPVISQAISDFTANSNNKTGIANLALLSSQLASATSSAGSGGNSGGSSCAGSVTAAASVNSLSASWTAPAGATTYKITVMESAGLTSSNLLSAPGSLIFTQSATTFNAPGKGKPGFSYTYAVTAYSDTAATALLCNFAPASASVGTAAGTGRTAAAWRSTYPLANASIQGSLRGVAALGGGFVAWGQDTRSNPAVPQRAYTSPDGSAWTPVSSAILDADLWSGVSSGNTLVVTNGGYLMSSPGNDSLYTTTDGASWTKFSSAQINALLPPGTSCITYVTSLAYMGGGFFASGYQACSGAMTAPPPTAFLLRLDSGGATWRLANTWPGSGRSTIGGDANSLWLYFANGVLKSVDGGNTWTTPSGSLVCSNSSGDAYSGACSPSELVPDGKGGFIGIVGNSSGYGGSLASSPDGLAWTVYPTPNSGSGIPAVTSLTYADGKFLATGSYRLSNASSDMRGALIASFDGVNWYLDSDMLSAGLNGIAVKGAVTVGVGSVTLTMGQESQSVLTNP